MTNPIIHILNKQVALYQPDKGYRTNQDAVLLAAACPAKKQMRVLDMGCGVGGALYALLFREKNLHLTGIDCQENDLNLAKDNMRLNDQNVTLIQDDVIQYRVNDPKMRFDHVIANPPYFEAEKHTASPTEKKSIARGYKDIKNQLDKWIISAFDNLKNFGSLTIIYPADQLDQIIQHLGNKFGAVEIFPILSTHNEPAKRVIIRSFKDRKSPCTLHRGIVLHEADGTFTKEADKLLRDGISFDTLLGRIKE